VGKMLKEMKMFRKRNYGHKDYFCSSEEKIFMYYEMTLGQIK
jgi:hypothetical protein